MQPPGAALALPGSLAETTDDTDKPPADLSHKRTMIVKEQGTFPAVPGPRRRRGLTGHLPVASLIARQGLKGNPSVFRRHTSSNKEDST